MLSNNGHCLRCDAITTPVGRRTYKRWYKCVVCGQHTVVHNYYAAPPTTAPPRDGFASDAHYAMCAVRAVGVPRRGFAWSMSLGQRPILRPVLASYRGVWARQSYDYIEIRHRATGQILLLACTDLPHARTMMRAIGTTCQRSVPQDFCEGSLFRRALRRLTLTHNRTHGVRWALHV